MEHTPSSHVPSGYISPEVSIDQDDLPKSGDEIFHDHQDEIIEHFQSIIKHQNPEIAQKKIDLCVEHERQFINVIFNRVQSVLQLHGDRETLLLFDIDGTMGLIRQELEDESSDLKTKFELRPGIIALFHSYLMPLADRHKLRMGILSTRPEEDTKKRMGDPNNLGMIGHYLSADSVYSSDTKLNIPRGIPLNEIPQYIGGYYHGILSQKAFTDPNSDYSYMDVPKVVCLSQAKEKLAGKNVIIADDLPYTRYLDESQGFYGIDLINYSYFLVDEDLSDQN